jgi:hypothetical protein
MPGRVRPEDVHSRPQRAESAGPGTRVGVLLCCHPRGRFEGSLARHGSRCPRAAQITRPASPLEHVRHAVALFLFTLHQMHLLPRTFPAGRKPANQLVGDFRCRDRSAPAPACRAPAAAKTSLRRVHATGIGSTPARRRCHQIPHGSGGRSPFHYGRCWRQPGCSRNVWPRAAEPTPCQPCGSSGRHRRGARARTSARTREGVNRHRRVLPSGGSRRRR